MIVLSLVSLHLVREYKRLDLALIDLAVGFVVEKEVELVSSMVV